MSENFCTLTSWYIDASRRGLHEAGGDLLVAGATAIRHRVYGVVGALLGVARVEVVDLVPRQVRLAQLKRDTFREMSTEMAE